MEISQRNLLAICAGLFAGVVALNFVQQYRSNEAFKTKLTGFDLNTLRTRLQREEGITSDTPELEQPIEWPVGNIEDTSEGA